MTTLARFLQEWRERNERIVARSQQAKAGVNLPLEMTDQSKGEGPENGE